ncbi:hypothetical protein [Knoellia koreensis]|nr:hypothetical protein [Knoellia sp. DB2414S]
MDRIEDAVRAGGSVPAVRVVESDYLSTGQGAHEQVENRAYAEQLVCEANAVLSAAGRPVLELEDHSGSLDQVFDVRVGEHWARFATRFDHGRSIGELLGSSLPLDPTATRHKLMDAEALEDFIVGLVAGSGDVAATNTTGARS